MSIVFQLRLVRQSSFTETPGEYDLVSKLSIYPGDRGFHIGYSSGNRAKDQIRPLPGDKRS
jgi:hypothetical protein